MRANFNFRNFLFLILLGTISLPCFALSPLKEAEDRRDVNSDAITTALNSPQSQQRLNAAVALGRIQKSEGIDHLLKLINDKEFSVQKEALFSLGQFAWSKDFSKGRESEITEKISPRLKSEEAEIRKAAVESIGKIGLEKTPSLVAPLLKDTHASVRAASVMALYRYRLLLRLRDNISNPPLLNESDMQTLLSLAGDSSKEVRRNVAYYFSRVKDERGKDAVLSLLYSPDLWTRYFATNALSKFSADDQLISATLSATEDENYSVRTAAVQAAGAFKIADKLGPALRGDPSFHVRIAYIQALSSLLGDSSTSEELLTETKIKLNELFLDSNLSVKAEALKALAQIKNEDTTNLINTSLQSTEWVLRVAAVEASNNLDSSLKKDILKNAAKDNDVRVRVSALESLGSEENSYAYDIIEDALESKELSERGTAVSDLQNRKESSRFAAAYKCYTNSQEEKWVELREEIIKIWASENTPETNQYLREAVLDKNSSVAHLAANTLQERGITDFPEPSNNEELSFSPYREITFKRNPKVFLETNKGILTLELYPKQAPIHVANMVGFAEEGKYNGLPIHRVVSNFVIQGGDPDKSGWGSAGYSLRAEINHVPFERGSVGMPRSTGFDTGGVQFFINHVPTPHLDGQYTVFGKVIDNLEVIDQSEVGDVILKSWVEY